MWASLLPSTEDQNGVESALFDVDINVELPIISVPIASDKKVSSSSSSDKNDKANESENY